MKLFARRMAELEAPGRRRSIAVSDWISVTQERIQLFADATGDHQWIHVDPERAKAARSERRSRTASSRSRCCPRWRLRRSQVRDARMGVNYGLNKVRFPAPVPSGSRVRGHFKLFEVTRRSKAARSSPFEVAMEREGSDKPVCIAESVGRRFA